MRGKEAMAWRLGRLSGAIESARESLRIADQQRDLLSEQDARLIEKAAQILVGIAQRSGAP